jgi:hypothetical protein
MIIFFWRSIMGKEHETDNEPQQFWQMAIDTWQASGLAVRHFCKQEGLSEPSFYSWRKKLATCDSPKDSKVKEPASSGFIAVSLPQSHSAGLELILVSGNTLRISPSVDSKALTLAISVLQEAGLC